MTLSPLFDTISVLLMVSAFVLLMIHRKRIKEIDSLLFGSLLVLLLGYFSFLFFPSDEFEDIFGALIPLLFAFVYYSILQRQSNQRIAHNEERLRLAVDATKAGLWNLNIEKGELIISQAWFEILGYREEDFNPITTEVWKSLIHPDDYTQSRESFVAHLQGKLPMHEATLRIKHRNGSWIWFQTRGKAIEFDNNGLAIRMTGTLIDLSKQKQLEINLMQQLEENEMLFEENQEKSLSIVENQRKYKALYENSNDGIVLISEGIILDCNKRTFEMFQCEPEFLIGKDPAAFSPAYQANEELSSTRAKRYFAKVYAGHRMVFDWQHIRPNGEPFDVSVSLNVLELNKEKYIQAVLRDITEDKRIATELEKYRHNLERLVQERTVELQKSNQDLKATMDNLRSAQIKLVQSEKMASLGILTAGIAHEINNPLNFIMGGYRGLEIFLKEQLNEDPQLVKLLNSIKIGADRAIDIVKGLNQFSRTKETFDEDCNINEILDNCLLLLNNRIKGRIEVVKNYQEGNHILKGNVGKLHQIFTNIIHNASDAIKDTGKIEITTGVLQDKFSIEILDNGEGISSKDMKKLVDPFFTTKEPGKGTGLGLSLTYSFVKEHKGDLLFESELGKGTYVSILLPLP